MCQPQHIPFRACENVVSKPRTSSTKGLAPNSEILLTAPPRGLKHLSIQKLQNVVKKVAVNDNSVENREPSPFKRYEPEVTELEEDNFNKTTMMSLDELM